MVCVLGDLGGQVVADVAVESGDLHEVLVQVLLDLGRVRLDAVGAVLVEGDAGVGNEANRLQAGVGHDRLEHVELEVALRTGEADGRVVAEDAGGDHRHGLALGRVHLAGHDRRAGLVLGDEQLTNAVARATGVPAHVVGDLHEGVGQHAQRPGDLHQSVMGGQVREEVVGLLEVQTGLLGDVLGDGDTELGVGVEAGTHGSAADGQFTGPRVSVADAIQREVDLGDPPADDLPQTDRGGVLQVGATHHDDVVVLLGLLVQGVTKLGDGRVKTLVDGCDDGDVHRGGEGVVGRLATIDVVVGVHRGLGSQLTAGQFDGAVADDLVGVHVRLGAGAGLEDDQWKLGVELAGNDLVSSLDDEVCHVARELTELLVGQGGGFLQSAQGTNHVASPHEGVAADLEVVEGALGLGSPVVVCRHVNGAHAVFFSTHLCHEPSLLGNEVIGASGWRDF